VVLFWFLCYLFGFRLRFVFSLFVFIILMHVTIPLLFWNLFYCMYYFELLQTNNNTFNDIGINNLIKLYNITCACSNLYFSNRTTILFLKQNYIICTTLISTSNIIMQINIPQNISHKLSTSKNKNKKFNL
jgi:monomeric isocitrate dehydrogenase